MVAERGRSWNSSVHHNKVITPPGGKRMWHFSDDSTWRKRDDASRDKQGDYLSISLETIVTLLDSRCLQ